MCSTSCSIEQRRSDPQTLEGIHLQGQGPTNCYHLRAGHECSGKSREVPVARRIIVAKKLHAQALGNQHEERSSLQRLWGHGGVREKIHANKCLHDQAIKALPSKAATSYGAPEMQHHDRACFRGQHTRKVDSQARSYQRVNLILGSTEHCNQMN